MAFEQVTVASEALRGNALGDPHERPLWVYLLQGFTGQGRGWFNVTPFQPSFPELVEQLAPACLVVLVDAWTSIGGSQFVDSPAVGRYHTYLCEDVVGFVDARYRTLAERG